MTYLQFPNYPDLPDELKKEIFKIAELQDSETYDDLLINSTPEVIKMVKDIYGFEGAESKLGYTGLEARKMFPDLVKYHFLDASDKIKKWVNDTLPIKAASINIQTMTSGKSIAPHIDEIRQYALNYLLSSGGDVDLKFYELKGPADEQWVHPQIFIPYDKLEVKETTKVPLNTWHMLPTSKIHSVENFDPTQKRIALTISIL